MEKSCKVKDCTNEVVSKGFCRMHYYKDYHKSHYKKIKNRRKEYRLNNKDKISQYSKKYYLNKKDKITEYKKEWYRRKKGI